MYAGSTLECAVHETLFHEIQHDAPRKSIPFSVVENSSYAIVQPRRDLVLAGLFEPDLNLWGLTRHQLIDTFAADYEATAKWAVAIHDTFSDIDGLVWTSRRCDPEKAYLLFGDRVLSDQLDIMSQEAIRGTNRLLQRLRNFAERAGILLSF
jgi:TFIIF-interacting CTD phosphatase-like protein